MGRPRDREALLNNPPSIKEWYTSSKDQIVQDMCCMLEIIIIISTANQAAGVGST